MIVPIDEARFAAAGLAFGQDGETGLFRLMAGGSPAEHVLAWVKVGTGGLQFLPERCASHRQVLGMLDAAQP